MIGQGAPPASVRVSARRSWTALSASADNDEVEEEDGFDPLGDGIDSVSWLPTVNGKRGEVVFGPSQDSDKTLPLFPLGGIVYTPNSEHVLNIFEPRYRQMYTDILMNGSKRFVVCMSHPDEPGRFAQTGVLFELEDLKEVSEQTKDQIKYVCNHKVTGRVQISKILNADAWESRETYLKVEGTIINDTKPKEPTVTDPYGSVAEAQNTARAERSLQEAFKALVDVQHDMEESVRFTKASVGDLIVGADPNNGLWQFIRLWQSYADQRLMARQNDLQADFQAKLQEFLKKDKGMSESELPSFIGFQDLSPSLQKEVQELQARVAVELEPLVLESTLTMQKILETKDHPERVRLLQYFVDAERKRLDAKKFLKGMFSSDEAVGTTATTTSSSSSSGSLSESDEAKPPSASSLNDLLRDSDNDADGPTGALLMDEPDAFQ